mgnify:CR=1 FL=1
MNKVIYYNHREGKGRQNLREIKFPEGKITTPNLKIV